MAAWGLEPLLLRQIAHLLAGANWQRSGGKSPKPKPIDLPGEKPDRATQLKADVLDRLLNLNLPPDDSEPVPAVAVNPAEQPAGPSPDAPRATS